MKVYVTLNDYDKEAIQLLESNGFDVTINPISERPNEEELMKLVTKFDVLIIGAREKITENVYTNSTKTKIIGTLSIGLDHIDSNLLSENKIDVINCPDSNVISVAEQTLGYILYFLKKFKISHNSSIKGLGRNGLGGLPSDLANKTIGIIGAGRIARKLISITRSFNCKYLVYTFNPTNHQDLKSNNLSFVKLEELIAKSDIVSIHIPLSEKTQYLLNEQHSKLFKPDSILINTSRLKIIDFELIKDLLSMDKIKGIALDGDLSSEELSAITRYDNILLTPHTAGITKDSIIRMDMELAIKLVKEKNG